MKLSVLVMINAAQAAWKEKFEKLKRLEETQMATETLFRRNRSGNPCSADARAKTSEHLIEGGFWDCPNLDQDVAEIKCDPKCYDPNAEGNWKKSFIKAQCRNPTKFKVKISDNMKCSVPTDKCTEKLDTISIDRGHLALSSSTTSVNKYNLWCEGSGTPAGEVICKKKKGSFSSKQLGKSWEDTCNRFQCLEADAMSNYPIGDGTWKCSKKGAAIKGCKAVCSDKSKKVRFQIACDNDGWRIKKNENLAHESCSPSTTTTTTSKTTTTTTTSTTSSTATTTSTTLPSTTTTSSQSTTTTPPSDCTGPAGIEAVSPSSTTVSSDSWLDYESALHKSILFYEAQMSGQKPSWSRIPWRGDSALHDGCDEGVDLTGGFYDAGDHVKFNFPAAFALNTLAWGMIEYEANYKEAGEYNASKRIIDWGVDYFKRCHTGPTELYAQVGDGDVDHSTWIRPEQMTETRPVLKIDASKPGSDLAGQTAALFASAALLYKDSDLAEARDLLRRARELLDFADDHRAKYSDSIATGDFYKSWSGYMDELVLAAAWIAKASREVQPGKFNADLQRAKDLANHDLGWGGEYSWDNKTPAANLLMYQVLEAAGDSQKEIFKTKIAGFVDNLKAAQRSPGGMVFIQQWGSARHAANAAFIAKVATDAGAANGDSFAKGQLDYLLGDGPSGHPLINGRQSSFMVGHGNKFPTKPHHRASSCRPASEGPCDWSDKDASGANRWRLNGALIGGPRSATDNFVNDRGDFVTNEVALDYNAGFQGLIAAYIGSPATTPSTTTTSGSTSTTSGGGGGSDCDAFSKTGHLTQYSLEQSFSGNCEFAFDSGANLGITKFVALPKSFEYNNGLNCGRCIKIKCSCEQSAFDGVCSTGQDTIAMVADSCPECSAGDVDSNLLVWNSVTGNESPSRFDASWEFVECPSAFRPKPNTQLRWKEGSSQWWLGLQPTNMRFGITSIIATRSDGTEFSLPVGGNDVGFSFWFLAANQFFSTDKYPMTITVTNTEGSTASATVFSTSEIVANTYLDLDALL